MRAKPEMKPWVNIDKKNKNSVGVAQLRAFGLCRCGFVALHSLRKYRSYGAQKCVGTINPGLAPWAMKGYRPCRAHLRPPQSITWLF